ncbi:Hypothetical Protein RradSPS_2409 [Rubrobacter radiotolerans]|uniref:Uncharacterized protein n=1 Tax=Rubrobacter radiotolerans TaxID=42256 RepID=A0A023X5F3_RUBRA|nr:hypothetical protein [Rubrobacter radiotolerans]AHY47692.1 Hypothetical Protein RradSPS_2409 [Rubrobacter radiotolerans]MDX5895095.1 hypothetical protein [Rubrobacter radiotolerans]SMC07444.1 hypothetical protein SAMN00767673_2410 [Rubrobacter radiotolerans DSM 5868]
MRPERETTPRHTHPSLVSASEAAARIPSLLSPAAGARSDALPDGLASRTALALAVRLEELVAEPDLPQRPELLAEAAGLLGDLATLAACNAGESRKSLHAEVLVLCEASGELEALAASDGRAAEGSFAARDLRVGAWKAALAARQLSGEPPEPAL